MKIRIVYDADGTKTLNVNGHKITTQLFHDFNGSGLVLVCNKKGNVTQTYHFGKVYLIERIK